MIIPDSETQKKHLLHTKKSPDVEASVDTEGLESNISHVDILDFLHSISRKNFELVFYGITAYSNHPNS